jgi:hypothetical protein
MMRRGRRTVLGLCLAWTVLGAQAQDAEGVDLAPTNLMPVLRESAGANDPEEALRPYGKLRVPMVDGSEVELEPSWFQYLGDMHIRLVFDGKQSMQSASPEDLDRMRLDPEHALALAVTNLRRVYGVPSVRPWSGSLMQVQGTSADLNSSYFLDRAFWRELEDRHPGGLVAAVPRRAGLVFAPADDADAVAQLRFSAAALYASGARTRLSSALYLFKQGRWTVYQPPATHY